MNLSSIVVLTIAIFLGISALFFDYENNKLEKQLADCRFSYESLSSAVNQQNSAIDSLESKGKEFQIDLNKAQENSAAIAEKKIASANNLIKDNAGKNCEDAINWGKNIIPKLNGDWAA